MFVFLSVLALSAVEKDRCSLCQTGLGIVHDAINAGYDDKQIVDALKASCPTLPSQYVPICNAFLKNIEHILAEIRAGKDDKAICAEYSLCAQKPKVEAANGLICDLCVDLVKKVEEIMVSTKIEADVIALATKYCEKLSAPYSTLCDSLVKQYVPMIMQYLEQGLEHLEICQKISLCEASKKSRAADPVLCDLCTELVKKIEDILEDTKVEADVEKLAKEYCDKLQSIYATLCETLVSQYVPQVMQWLEQGLDHLEICQKLHMCSSTSYKVKDTVLCDLCTELIAKIEDILKDTKIEEDVEKLAKEYCSKLGTMYSALCEALVTQYVPQIMQWLEQGLEHEEICQKLHMCAATKQSRVADPVLCDLCTELIKKIDEILEDTKVEEDVEKLAKEYCAKLGSIYATLCETLVSQYVPQIMQWLEQGLNHLEICQKLHMCSSSSYKVKDTVLCDLCTELIAKIEEILVDTKIEEDVEKLAKEYCAKLGTMYSALCEALVTQYVPQIMQWLEQGLEHEEICQKLHMCAATKVARNADNGFTCDACITIVQYIEKLMLDTKVESEIEQLVEKFCDKLPVFSAVCDKIVEKYVPLIMQWLEQGLEHEDICKKLGFCTNGMRATSNSFVCDLCTELVAKIEQIMVSTKVEKDVIELAQKYCEKLPVPYSTLCDSLVAQYVPQIMQYLEQGLEHIEICKKISLCPKEALRTNSLVCDLCTELVAKIEEIMVDTKLEKDVIELAQKYCNKLAVPMSTLCDSLVAQYVPTIMEYLEQGLEHKHICQKINFCPTTIMVRAPVNGFVCDTCVHLVGYIEKLLDDTKVESEVAHLLDQYCDKLPAVAKICDIIVDKYVPIIMQWLEKDLEHLEICNKLGFCDSKKTSASRNGIVCDLCTELVAKVEEIMVDTKLEKDVIELAQEYCNKLAAPMSTLCDSLVAQYVPTIMQYLEQGLEHLEVCQKISLCPTTFELNGARIPISYENGVTCDVCKDFFKWAEDELEKYTVPYLWKLVNEKCPNVPYLRQFCKIINVQNIETFVNLLISQAPPAKCCQFLKICQ